MDLFERKFLLAHWYPGAGPQAHVAKDRHGIHCSHVLDDVHTYFVPKFEPKLSPFFLPKFSLFWRPGLGVASVSQMVKFAFAPLIKLFFPHLGHISTHEIAFTKTPK